MTVNRCSLQKERLPFVVRTNGAFCKRLFIPASCGTEESSASLKDKTNTGL